MGWARHPGSMLHPGAKRRASDPAADPSHVKLPLFRPTRSPVAPVPPDCGCHPRQTPANTSQNHHGRDVATAHEVLVSNLDDARV